MALGGIMAALAVVIMALGGMIPLSTFVCPVFCILILRYVREKSGNRIAWAWYGAVAILSVLLGPDKEASAVFVFLGNYPIIKTKMDKLPLKWLWKLVYFNAAILLMYWLLMNLLGMAEVAAEFAEMGTILTVVTLVMGNVTFILLDRILGMRLRRR